MKIVDHSSILSRFHVSRILKKRRPAVKYRPPAMGARLDSKASGNERLDVSEEAEKFHVSCVFQKDL